MGGHALNGQARVEFNRGQLRRIKTDAFEKLLPTRVLCVELPAWIIHQRLPAGNAWHAPPDLRLGVVHLQGQVEPAEGFVGLVDPGIEAGNCGAGIWPPFEQRIQRSFELVQNELPSVFRTPSSRNSRQR